jgi:hypothetical protein
MLVDTGPDETYPALRRRLSAIPVRVPTASGTSTCSSSATSTTTTSAGAAAAERPELGLSFGDIWFNAPACGTRTRGVAEGQSLAELLGRPRRRCRGTWPSPASLYDAGRGWRGGVTGPGPHVTLLSPTPDRLESLYYKVWAKELERLRRKERDLAEPERPATRGCQCPVSRHWRPG